MRAGNSGNAANVQRHAIVEQSASRLEQSSSIASQRIGDAGPRSGMRGIGDRIAIEAQPEVDRHSLAGAPLIAGEPGELILIYGKPGGRSELDPFDRVTGGADNVHRRESLPPVIGAVRKVEARLQSVRAEKMPLTRLGRSPATESGCFAGFCRSKKPPSVVSSSSRYGAVLFGRISASYFW